ncbi:MAG: hypothetical protein QXD05_01915, partial [Candidatus Pacearchaeota archaeon]
MSGSVWYISLSKKKIEFKKYSKDKKILNKSKKKISFKNFIFINLICLLFFFFINVVSAEPINDTLHINLQTTYPNGSIQNGTFSFAFNITENSSSSCLGPVVYNHSTTLTTDSRGIVSIYLPKIGSGGGNLSSLSFDKQYYLCYYRDGSLKDVIQLGRVPYSFRATQVNLSEIKVDSNLTLGDFNISASSGFFNFLGSITNRIASFFAIDGDISKNLTLGGNLSVGGHTTVSGNVSASWFKGAFNWIIGSFSQTYLSFNGTHLDFNESFLNGTIDARIGIAEPDLDVNSSLFWRTGDRGPLRNVSQIRGSWITNDLNWINGSYGNATYVLRTNWSTIDDYPVGCPDGFAVQVIGDTLTCIRINTTLGVGNVSGGGTANTITKWITGSTIGNSKITDDGVIVAVDSSDLYINTTSGNVGIGTTSPIERLDVVGTIQATGPFQTTGNEIIYAGSPLGQVKFFRPATTNDIALYAGGFERLRINGSGFVGINTTIPKNTLNVIGDANITEKLYAKFFFGDGSGLTNVNADRLDGYDSSFFMPLNTSVRGDFDFNGGWQQGGLSIIGGDIYARTGYFYNISALQVTNLEMNGSLIPDLDNTFDLGNLSYRWRDIYFSRDAIALASDVADNSSSNSADFVLRGKYDSNTSIGSILQVNRDITLRNIVDWASGLGEYRLAFLDNSNNEFVTFKGDTQRVGIGTTSPQNKLNIIGDANVTSSIYGGSIYQGGVQVLNTITAGSGLVGGGSGPSTSLSINFGPNFLGWGNLTNYPDGCPDGFAVQVIGDTLTCIQINATTGVGNVSGGGTANTITKWITGSTIGNSKITDDGVIVAVDSSDLYINTTSGNVGVGTASPGEKLHVAGKISIGLTNDEFRLSSESGYRKIQSYNGVPLSINPEGNNVGIGIDTSPDALLDIRSNNAGTGLIIDMPSSQNHLAFETGESRKWVQYLVGNDLRFWDSTGGGDRVTFQTGGNVGIGIITPQQTLHVNGSVVVNGTINTDGNRIINIANGTAAQDAVTLSQLQEVNKTANNVTGGGTANTITKWITGSTIGNSKITDDGVIVAVDSSDLYINTTS